MADQRPEVVPKTEARQGETPHMARYVLTYGLGGVIVLFVLIYIIFFGH
jgi:hypothetical protein